MDKVPSWWLGLVLCFLSLLLGGVCPDLRQCEGFFLLTDVLWINRSGLRHRGDWWSSLPIMCRLFFWEFTRNKVVPFISIVLIVGVSVLVNSFSLFVIIFLLKPWRCNFKALSFWVRTREKQESDLPVLDGQFHCPQL